MSGNDQQRMVTDHNVTHIRCNITCFVWKTPSNPRITFAKGLILFVLNFFEPKKLYGTETEEYRTYKEREAEQEMPKSKNKISYSQCLDYLADIKEYCGNGIIKLSYRNKKTELACVMQISGIDIFHYSTDDIYAVCNNFAKATNALSLPHKYIFSDKHPDLTPQLDYLEYKKNRTNWFSKGLYRKTDPDFKERSRTAA